MTTPTPYSAEDEKLRELYEYIRMAATYEAFESAITQRDTAIRIDELNRLNFYQATGYLAGDNNIVRQNVVTRRINELSATQAKEEG